MKHRLLGTPVRIVLVATLLFLIAGLAPAAASAESVSVAQASRDATSYRDVAGAFLTQPATNVAANTVYIVKRGDTLAKIAARYGVTIRALLAANPAIRNPNQIYVGQRLVIPTGATPGTTTQVSIYLIGIGTGKVGCGDQVVPVTRNVPATTAPLTAALNQLLSLHDQYYGQSGLYNALYQSHLSVKSITRSGTTWNIYLQGTMQLGGECENPRVEAQLMRTALQFSTVKQANYFINGVPLKTALSLK